MRLNKLKHRVLLAQVLVLCQLLSGWQRMSAWAQPCSEETEMYGGAVLDGSADEYEQYFVVADDDQTRITEFRYCVCCINRRGEYEHFRGFEATILSPITGYQTQQFGTMDGTDPDTFCEAHDMSMEELMWLTIYADSNDAEGIVWEGNFGSTWVSRANGNVSSGRLRMGGRPIGFRVWMGEGGMPNQPLKISVVYNACNCPASTYIGNNPFNDMECMAIRDGPADQGLSYQENYMENVYGQYCGSYNLEWYPAYPFFEFVETGASLDSAGNSYTDKGTFGCSNTNDDVGQYEVTMVTKQYIDIVEHGFDNPYRGIIPEVEQTFTLTINPCDVEELISTMQDIVYRIPEPAITQGSPGWAEVPNPCGYFLVEDTVNGLPGWATFNTLNKDFMVPQTNDQTRIGAYPVNLSARTEPFFTDWTKTATKDAIGSHDFMIYIEPCLVTSVDVVTPIADVYYTIGNPLGAVSDTYSFVQTPDCEYEITYEIIGLKDFFEHRDPSSDFNVFQTEDKSLVGIYPVQIRAQVTHFRDHTMVLNSTRTNAINFNIHLIDPCLDTKLNPLIINDMKRFVMEPGINQEIFVPQDIVSQTFGDRTGLTYCGPRVVEIVTNKNVYRNFMGYDPSNNLVTVVSISEADVGVYPIEARVYLKDYPQIEMSTTFEVEIEFCQISDIFMNPVVDQVYTVYTPDIAFNAEKFTFEPACAYDLEYQFQLKDPITGLYEPLPSWIVHDGNFNFSVQTDDPDNVGNYIISVIGGAPLDKMDPTYAEELEINLIVNNDCQIDDVTALDVIDNEVYTIGFDGIRFFNPTWSTTIPGCPVTYEIERVMDDGTCVPLTAKELAVLSHNIVDGQMQYSTNDFTLDQELWTLKLFKRSTYSLSPNRDGIYQFDIKFIDRCWEADVTPAKFGNGQYTFDLWQLETIIFEQMVDNTFGVDFCGGFTGELQYFEGPLLDPTLPMGADMSIYNQTVLPDPRFAKFDGVAEERKWIGTHYYRIKSTLGTYDPSPNSRGQNGLYDSYFSDPVPVTILDPCVNSTVNQDMGLLVEDLTVPQNKTVWQYDYKGPTNSMSALYGNGYDKCGPYKYTFLDDAGEKFELMNLSNYTMAGFNDADDLSFELQSFKNGADRYANFTMKVSLIGYPTSYPYYQLVNITYRECFPEDFSGPNITVDEMTVGDDGFELDVFFDQFPCDYPQEYTVTVIDKETGFEIDIPAFINPDGEIILIEIPENRDIGEFEVIVCSKIYNFYETESCIDFDITVVPEPTNTTYTEEPDFLLDVVDQRVKVGDPLIYSLGDTVNAYGYLMTVELFLGDAFRFARFDSRLNMFKVDRKLVQPEDVGVYPIRVTARLFNGKFDETYKKTFLLTVWDDPEIPEKKWFPPDPIFYDEWNFPIIKGEKQEFEPDRPIPYIRDLRTDGLLIIGWDRRMTVPGNYSVIEPSKVAVEETYERREDRFWEDRRVRSLRTYEDFEILENNIDMVYFADKNTRFYEQMKLLDAMELLITPDDIETGIRLNFTWEMVGYTQDWIYIQLTFENYWDIAGEQAYDTLSVTFWGVQYFQSWQMKEVLYGTTLYWPLVRQMNMEDMDFIRWFADFLKWPVIVSFILILPVITAGSLLPTWVFINSLQIISHMILLRSIMPAPAHYFLKQWNDWIRWYDPAFIEYLQEAYDWKRYGIDFGEYHQLFQLGEYTHLMAQNMVLIILVLLIFLTIWTMIIIKDFFVSFLPNTQRKKWWAKSHSSWGQNFLLRYLYEFFLEFCICVILQLSVKDLSDFSPSLQFFMSIGCFLAMMVLVFFVVGLFLIGGPWIPGFYKPNTVLQSAVFDYRTRDPKFNGKKWLKENPAPERKPWGTMIVNIDLNKVLNVMTCGKTNRREAPAFMPNLNFDNLYDAPADAPEKPDENIVPGEKQDDVQPTERGLLDSKPDDNEARPEDVPLEISPEDNNNNKPLERLDENTIDDQTVDKDAAPGPSKAQAKGDLSAEVFEGGQSIDIEKMQKLYAKNESYQRFKTNLENKQDGKKESSSDSSKNSNGGTDEDKALKRWARKEAHLRVKFADRVQTPQQYRTLFYGLKRNTERNVAIMHPLMFLIRRLVYALVIVFLETRMYVGIIIVMLGTLMMLAFALTEFQWKEGIINFQHIFDECIIYICCVFLLLYSSHVGNETRWELSYVMIGICFFYVIVNTIVIIYYSLMIMWRFLKRIFLQCRRRRLQIQALFVIQDLNAQRLGIFKEKQKPKPKAIEPEPIQEVAEEQEESVDSKDWFDPTNEGDMRFMAIDTAHGGYGAELVQVTETRTVRVPVEQLQSESNDSKGFFDADSISNKSERYDQVFYKEWETPWMAQIIDPNSKDQKMQKSQENFGNIKLLTGRKEPKLETEQKGGDSVQSQTANDFNSVHGLVTQTNAVDITKIEEEDNMNKRKKQILQMVNYDIMSEANEPKEALEARRLDSANSQRPSHGAIKTKTRDDSRDQKISTTTLTTVIEQRREPRLFSRNLADQSNIEKVVHARNGSRAGLHDLDKNEDVSPYRKNFAVTIDPQPLMTALNDIKRHGKASIDSSDDDISADRNQNPVIIMKNNKKDLNKTQARDLSRAESIDSRQMGRDQSVGHDSVQTIKMKPSQNDKKYPPLALRLGSIVNLNNSTNIKPLQPQLEVNQSSFEPQSWLDVHNDAFGNSRETPQDFTQHMGNFGMKRNSMANINQQQLDVDQDKLQTQFGTPGPSKNMMQSFQNAINNNSKHANKKMYLNPANFNIDPSSGANTGRHHNNDGMHEFDQIMKGMNASEFHKGKHSIVSNSTSFAMIPDAVSINGGNTRNAKNIGSILGDSFANSKQREPLFDTHKVTKTTYYQVNNAQQLSERDPEFIGLSGVNQTTNSNNQAVQRQSSMLDTSSLSMRNSSLEYNGAPLAATGLNILDSVPRLDDLAIKQPHERHSRQPNERSHQVVDTNQQYTRPQYNSVERTKRGGDKLY